MVPKGIRIFLIALLSIAASLTVDAFAADLSGKEIQIVVADDSEATKHISEALLRKFPGSQVVPEHSSVLPRQRGPIYITIGPAALRALLERDPGGCILSIFTSSQSYKSIVENAPRRGTPITAIYADPAPEDQMHLIALAYKRPVKVAVPLTEKTSYLVPALRSAASAFGMELDLAYLDSGDTLNRTLSRISQDLAILAVPDQSIYNAANVQNILMTAYGHNQAIVGFSTALVKAGALATTYSSIDDVITQADEILTDYTRSTHLPPPQFPKYFNTSINDSVARSLNLVVDDETRKFSRKPNAKQP